MARVRGGTISKAEKSKIGNVGRECAKKLFAARAVEFLRKRESNGMAEHLPQLLLSFLSIPLFDLTRSKKAARSSLFAKTKEEREEEEEEEKATATEAGEKEKDRGRNGERFFGRGWVWVASFFPSLSSPPSDLQKFK